MHSKNVIPIIMTLFNAEGFVSQPNFSYDYLTNTYNNSIPNLKLVDTTFRWKQRFLLKGWAHEGKCGYFKLSGIAALNSVQQVSMQQKGLKTGLIAFVELELGC